MCISLFFFYSAFNINLNNKTHTKGMKDELETAIDQPVDRSFIPVSCSTLNKLASSVKSGSRQMAQWVGQISQRGEAKGDSDTTAMLADTSQSVVTIPADLKTPENGYVELAIIISDRGCVVQKAVPVTDQNQITHHALSVIAYTIKNHKQAMTSVQTDAKILSHIRSAAGLSCDDIAATCSLSTSEVARSLSRLTLVGSVYSDEQNKYFAS